MYYVTNHDGVTFNCSLYLEDFSSDNIIAYKDCESQLTVLNACLRGGEPKFNIPAYFGTFDHGWDWIRPKRQRVEMTMSEVCDALDKEVVIVNK
jgi:hypothetical protein